VRRNCPMAEERVNCNEHTHYRSRQCFGGSDYLWPNSANRMSWELKSADLGGEDLRREILACENKVYETFLGPQPDVEAWQKLTLPDYLYINFRGVIWTREENAISLKSGVVFLSIRIKESQVRKLSPTSALIVARVLIEAAAGGNDLSTETLTSTVWVKQEGKWMAQLHTSIKAAQG